MPRLRMLQIITFVGLLAVALVTANVVAVDVAVAGGAMKARGGAYGPAKRGQKLDKSQTQMGVQRPIRAPKASGQTK